jgi:hypothetical protein
VLGESGLCDKSGRVLFLMVNKSNSYLEIARMTYTRTIAEIRKVHQALRQRLPALQLV